MPILEPFANRRDVLTASLLALAAGALEPGAALAAGVDPAMTIITPPDRIPWRPNPAYPAASSDQATLFGGLDDPGQYFVLIRWHPGYMSAPHHYATDRLCVVLSGTWYCASGADFAPDKTVPMPAGSFVRRVANTPHYDGVIKGALEPAVIAISGQGPVRYQLTDPHRPGWRAV